MSCIEHLCLLWQPVLMAEKARYLDVINALRQRVKKLEEHRRGSDVTMDMSQIAAQEQQRCPRCGAVMQRLEGLLWLANAEHLTWKISLPVCTTCNAKLFETDQQAVQ